MTYTDDRVDSGLTDRVSLLQNAMHKLGADVIRLQTQLSEIATAAPPRSQERAPASQFIFNLSRDEYRGFLKGNAMKYLWRYRLKNGVEDLRKAHWYLDRLIVDVEEADEE